jgi:hypothetical protein
VKDIVFSDWDGTASDHPELFGTIMAIITGRSWEEAQDLFAEAGDMSIPVFFNPVSSKKNNQMTIVHHKSSVINKIGVTTFYENVPEEATMLKILCPKTKIILVKEGVTAL